MCRRGSRKNVDQFTAKRAPKAHAPKGTGTYIRPLPISGNWLSYLKAGKIQDWTGQAVQLEFPNVDID